MDTSPEMEKARERNALTMVKMGEV